jgi:hypothetical protein
MFIDEKKDDGVFGNRSYNNEISKLLISAPSMMLGKSMMRNIRMRINLQ